MNKSRGIVAYSIAPHFLGSCFFTQKTLMSGHPPEGCINALCSPSPCSSRWAGVDHNAMLTYCLILLACFLSEYCSASGIKVFGLATHRTSAVFICCHVIVIESPACATVGVSLQTAVSTLTLCGQRMVCQKGRKTFIYLHTL